MCVPKKKPPKTNACLCTNTCTFTQAQVATYLLVHDCVPVYNFMYVCMLCVCDVYMHAMYIVCMHKHISLYIMHADTYMNYIRVYV